MTEESTNTSKRILDPFDRLSEVVCGVVMVITFTGTLSVAQAGRDDVHAMMLAAIGCNLAWAIVDAIMYLLARLAENSRNLFTLRAILGADDPSVSQQLIADTMSPVVAAVVGPEELASIHARLKAAPEPPGRAYLSKDDWMAAMGIFFLVLFVTFPLVVPFALVDDARTALRLSHTIAIVIMFLSGVGYGLRTGSNPWRAGLVMVVIGAVLAGVTVALGG